MIQLSLFWEQLNESLSTIQVTLKKVSLIKGKNNINYVAAFNKIWKMLSCYLNTKTDNSVASKYYSIQISLKLPIISVQIIGPGIFYKKNILIFFYSFICKLTIAFIPIVTVIVFWIFLMTNNNVSTVKFGYNERLGTVRSLI